MYFSRLHVYTQVAAVLAISEEVSEAELLSWAKDEMPTYQVSRGLQNPAQQ